MTVPLLLALTALGGQSTPPAAAADTRLFEIRTYFAAPGKLALLNARFRDHTVRLFKKHGITNMGYWVPEDGIDEKLVYLLAFPSKEARDKSFADFAKDPEWQQARSKSESSGQLVTKITSFTLAATDYSPLVKPTRSRRPRVFEMRTYVAAAGKLDALHARFRDHTVRLFRQHGMSNIGYWTPTEADQGKGELLVYLLAHDSVDKAKQSWQGFKKDPKWIAARDASEKDGTLVAKVSSVMLTPTDYSPTR